MPGPRETRGGWLCKILKSARTRRIPPLKPLLRLVLAKKEIGSIPTV